ncbi:hypothetical protein HG535_0G03710 [Zygotorulaspora mrakii]|uniref:DNA-directed RNA polymerase I subunit RPA14 n=1 Tax=Zygotorulaspora mrakii TaxID=42260 RepID=A0A7H9B6Y6_ZYGMR|nr:uncharacterized protein HG535_0G03710 [Zygotorulaspora mrakii]QLG74488.1 hypothetical protein HG535_0G03710 [Zygotorulaspora mrakii]
MLKSKRPGFVAATTLNTPVVVHALQQPQHASKDEVLLFLDEFIASKDGPDATDVDVNLSAALSQLKRMHRDFKGLPPTILAEAPVTVTAAAATEGSSADEANGTGSVTKSATGGTKKTFEE